MIAQPLQPDLYMVTFRIPTGSVNAYIIRLDEGLALVDTGYINSNQRLLQAIRELGYSPQDIRHLLVTHAHADHAGSLAALSQISGAPAYMHALDAPLVQAGDALRPETRATPGWPNRAAYALGVRLLARRITPTTIEHVISDGAVLPIGGGMQVVHLPGHSAGQVGFLWRERGVLFAADAAVNLFGALRYGPVVEDFAQLQRSIGRIQALTFDTACFGHGQPITQAADRAFRQRWPR